ncbi:hypothetical protein H6F90_13735 [Trichocoleus sp. FACHB-591]|uniref:HHL1-like protein n=1 Tax=unclassified Trichocoleus TaxID=2628910 RepID=UPI001688C63A|nr:HHL1-like protein [Trichocoleus sp. FACHB-262]MBD2096199.1 hypothetical protein [Trichocoleus sp. FACHB-591]MBD2120855.1 hypothetical protein [Trichocoleus sp. FACHB-262]
MTSGGFGKAETPKKSVSKKAVKRTEASKQYDKMKTDGVPEFNIYMRIQNKKQWYPVGSIAVKRSSQINMAIYDSEKDLREGAFRLFPILRKNQANLEYGYRLKEFSDEPIQIAVKPEQAVANAFQSAIANVKDRFTSLFKRS